MKVNIAKCTILFTIICSINKKRLPLSVWALNKVKDVAQKILKTKIKYWLSTWFLENEKVYDSRVCLFVSKF